MRLNRACAALVATWGRDDQAAFENIAADVPLPHEKVSSWSDPRSPIRLGRAQLGVSEQPLHSLSPIENCVVAFDGALYSARPSSAEEAVIEAYRRWGP